MKDKYVHLELAEDSMEANELMARLSAEGWHVSVRWVSQEELMKHHEIPA